MAKFTIDGITAQDVEDFAYATNYKDMVGIDQDEPNPVTKAQHCKDYVKSTVVGKIKGYRKEVLVKALEEPTEPDITVV